MAKNKIRPAKNSRTRRTEPRSKTAMLRMRIMRELMMISSALALMGLLMYVAVNWQSEREAARSQLDGEVKGLSSQVSGLKTKLSRVEKALPIFDRLFPNKAAPEIPLDRRLAAEQIEKLKEDFFFSVLRISMSPPRDLEEPGLKNRFVAGTAVDIQLSAEALSDEHVLRFIDTLRNVVPGYLQIQSISFTRLEQPTSQMMALITQSGKVGLVKAEAKMVWMGLKPLNAPAKPPETPPPPAPAPASSPGGGG